MSKFDLSAAVPAGHCWTWPCLCPRPPFGEHQGEPICGIPAGYLAWLIEQPWLVQFLRGSIGYELCRRENDWQRRSALLAARNTVPLAVPRTVCGIHLEPYESALLEGAERSGVLRLEPWVPVGNRAEEAWRRLCEASGRPCRIEEECPA